jgi:hypothetical protein
MKKFLPSLMAAFLLSAILPVHATLIVYGIINGVVISSSGGLQTTVGMPVSGAFSYDHDLLSAPDSSGNRTVSIYDPNADFYITSSVGEGGGFRGSIEGADPFWLTVDINGLPHEGSGAGDPDIGIGSSYVGVAYGADIFWMADVNYTVTGVPDTGATWFLLGLGLAGVMVARRLFGQMRG